MSAAIVAWCSARCALERGGGAHGDIARGFARRRAARVGRRHGRVAAQQRRVGVAEERHVGHRERAQRLAVVAAGERDEAVLSGLARVAPVVERHLQRDLRRRGAVGAVEAVAERPGASVASRSESSTTGSCVKPASITWSSVLELVARWRR